MIRGGASKSSAAVATASFGGDRPAHEKVAAQLHAEHRRLEFLLSATSAVTYSCKVTAPFGATFVSENLSALLGYTSDEFVADPGFWASRIHPDDRERILAGVANVFTSGRHVHEYRFRDARGSYRWLHDELVLVRDDDGNPAEMVGVFFDVSSRKEAEQAVRRSEANFRALIESLPDGVLVHRDQRIVYANRAMRALLRASAEEDVLGLSPMALTPESERQAVRERIRRLQKASEPARSVPMEFDIVRLDGTRVPCEVEAMTLDFDGAPAVLVLMRDMTERRAMRASLAAADRLASMGALAAGVAHELNNPLSYVLINLTLLGEHLPELIDDREGAPLRKPQIQALLADAREGAARMRDVVRDLLSLSRHDVDTVAPIDVRKVLESCLRIAQSDIRHAARLTLDLGEVPLIEGNATRLGQVLLNLLVNATQAIPAGNAQANEIRVATRTAPNGDVLVEISDTGTGIPEEIRGRIFDPFFTTKPLGVGTGLGLSICHGIVTSMKGTIDVESTSRGTTFRVTLPSDVRAAATDAPSLALAAPHAPPRRGRVLVVDDTEAICATLRLLLEPAYDVTTVTRAKAALEHLARGADFDVILCDVMMPEMDGPHLFEHVAKADARLAERFVFLTGGAFTESARAFLERVPNARLEKPFETAELLDLLAHKMTER